MKTLKVKQENTNESLLDLNEIKICKEKMDAEEALETLTIKLINKTKPLVSSVLHSKKTEEKNLDKFWNMVKDLNDCYMKSLKKENAVGEFVRVIRLEKNFEDIFSFTATYQVLKNELYDLLKNTNTERGDDGHGDLIDSLPLLGKKAIKELVDLVKEKPKNINKFEDKYKNEHNYALVFEGENYNTMTLKDEIKEHLPSYAIEIEEKIRKTIKRI